jgi:hypothetical protein
MSRRLQGIKPIAMSLAVASVMTFASRHSHAGNEAAAQALFDAAKKLAQEGKYAEACPKFAESNRLDRGAGTLIHLGDCYEKNKQAASAWASYKDAASAAQALGRSDWEKLASQRAAALEPKLARLSIKVTDPAPKLEVLRDGAPVSQASWGVAIPVDVGPHAIEATAKGFKSFKVTKAVDRDGDSVEVTVPKLESETAATTPETTPQTTPPPTTPTTGGKEKSSQRTIGFVVGGVGVAGLAVGAVTGLMAMGKSSDAKKSCSQSGPCASKSAVDAADGAKSLGLVSTIAFVGGAVGVAAGAVLVFTAQKEGSKTGAKPPNQKVATVRVTPSVGPGSGGFVLSGTFE